MFDSFDSVTLYVFLHFSSLFFPYQATLDSNWPSSNIGGGCYWEHDSVRVCDQVLLDGQYSEGNLITCGNSTRNLEDHRFPERFARR